MIALPFIVAAVAVLPSDRMAMADRMFDRGEFEKAKAEYSALVGVDGIDGDEILYRIAETSRVTGDKANARKFFAELLTKHPGSQYTLRARLMRALCGTDDEQRRELKALDTDETPDSIRVSVLYHLGILNSDIDALTRCLKIESAKPGRYAEAARFRRAVLMAESKDPTTRRRAVGEFNDMSFSSDKAMARSALYMTLRCCYSEGRFAESGPLARRFLKTYGNEDQYSMNVRVMAAWSFYRVGKWTEARDICGGIKSDDFDYLRAACALSSGDKENARKLFNEYLEQHPNGKYRSVAELPLARLDFASASKSDDKSATIEAARRGAEISKAPADRFRYAWALENAGRKDEAKSEYARIARDFPSTADAAESLFRKAMIDARDGRWSETELALAEALSGEVDVSRRADMTYWRGIAAYKSEHAAEGVALLREALELGLTLDESREARLIIADADFKDGRKTAAKEAYAKLVREGACERMNAAKIRNVGRFLIDKTDGVAKPQEALICGKALAEIGDSPEWRQSGWILKGAAEEAQGAFTAAIESYKKAMAEKVSAPTEDLPDAALALGTLESRAGQFDAADATLREAVALTARDVSKRVRVYLQLADNCRAAGRMEDAKNYAILVKTLFLDDKAAKAADAILEAMEGGAK